MSVGSIPLTFSITSSVPYPKCISLNSTFFSLIYPRFHPHSRNYNSAILSTMTLRNKPNIFLLRVQFTLIPSPDCLTQVRWLIFCLIPPDCSPSGHFGKWETLHYKNCAFNTLRWEINKYAVD